MTQGKTSVFVALAAAAALATAVALSSTRAIVSATPVAAADAINCNLSQYKPASGLTAAAEQDALLVSWPGQNGAEVRARYAIDGGQPTVRELAIKKAGGPWTTLGRNLTPEYHV